MNDPIFLLSTGRTGTKFFSEFFDAYARNVASYHTTRNTRFINIVSNLYARRLIPALMAGSIWKALKYKSIKSHPSRYVENNPFYYSLSGIISSYFPDAKFIYIVRSPKTYVLSHIKKERQNIRSKIANCLIPFWQPLSYIEHLKGLFDDFYQRVDFYSRIWNYKNAILLKEAEKKKNILILRFEDIFDKENGPTVLNHLVGWLGMQLRRPVEGDSILQKVNPSKPDESRKWDRHCDEIIRTNCGELITRFHYRI